MTTGSRTHHAIDYIEFPVTDMKASQRFHGAAFGDGSGLAVWSDQPA